MANRLVIALCAAVVLVGTSEAGAVAPVALTVTNDGQPGLESDVPQPPVSVAARGSCDTPFSAQEANGGPAPCPPGSWPGAGGEWSPRVDVAGGDVLRLTFEAPAERVRVASTTNFPPGLMVPCLPPTPNTPPPPPGCGTPVPNEDIIVAQDAEPTDDAHVFTVKLPPVGYRPGTFSVVARAGETSSNFALSIGTPRWKNEQTRCGTVYYDSDKVQYSCPSAGVKGVPPIPGVAPKPAAPTTPNSSPCATQKPSARVLIGRKARLRGRVLTIGLRLPSAGTLRLIASMAGDSFVGRRRVDAAGWTRVPIQLSEATAGPPRRLRLQARFKPCGGERVLTGQRRVTLRKR